MYDVLCLSDCCCDMIFQGLKRLPAPGEEEYGSGFALRAGGGANTPMGLARLGSRTAYAATVGEDALGALVAAEMEKSGLSDRFLRRARGGRTWVSAVLSTGDDRAFASYAGASADYTVAELAEMVASARWVHTYVYYLTRYPDLGRVCREKGVPLSLDMGYDPSQTLADMAPLFSQATLLTPNEQEALTLTGRSDARDALDDLRAVCPNVVITLGSQGCLAALDGAVYRAYPPRVEAVDANGAGDLFNAGLLHARGQDCAPEKQLALACASGAAAVQCVGGLDESYTAEKVAALARAVRVETL